MPPALATPDTSSPSSNSRTPMEPRDLASKFLGAFFGRDREFTWALGLVALIPRLFVAVALTGEPVWDGHYYELGAERIAEGFGYSEEVLKNGQTVTKPWSHYPVGFSAILAIIFRLFGVQHEVFGTWLSMGTLFGAVVGASLAMVTHRLARYFLSENRARLAGTIVALHPGLIAYAGVLMTEPLAALLGLLAIYADLAIGRVRPRLVAVGVLVGLATLVRPLSLTLLPVIFFLGKARGPGRLLQTFWIALVSACVILPWTARNCRVMDGCALVSTNGGWNLAIGAITESGRFEALKADDGCPVVTGQVQQDRCWRKVGLARIVAEPGRWLRVVPRKLSQAYDHESFPIEYLREARPELWPEARRVRGRELLTLFHRLLVFVAVLRFVAPSWPLRTRGSLVQAGLGIFVASLGLYCFESQEHPFYLLVLLLLVLPCLPLPGRLIPGRLELALLTLLALTTLTYAMFFGEDRYHFVITPVFALLAAGALPQGRADLPLETEGVA